MSYDLYTTWGYDGVRELDEDAINREFRNAGVSYCGDFSEFIETGYDGYESVNEVAIQHAINREKDRRNQEMMMFRELASKHTTYEMLVNQVPIDIYIPEFDAYDSVYLMHTDPHCNARRDAAYLGGFSTQQGFVDYIIKKMKTGRHVLPCPICDLDMYRGDAKMLAIGRAIVYSLKNGRPQPRNERRTLTVPKTAGSTRQTAPMQASQRKAEGYNVMVNSKTMPLRTPDDDLIFVRFFHPSNSDCIAKDECGLKGPFKNIEDAFNNLNVGQIKNKVGEMKNDEFVFPCPRCYGEDEYEKHTHLKGLYQWIDFQYTSYLCNTPQMRNRLIEDNEKKGIIVDSFAAFKNYSNEQTKRITAMARHEIVPDSKPAAIHEDKPRATKSIEEIREYNEKLIEELFGDLPD